MGRGPVLTPREAADEVAEILFRILDECGQRPILLTVEDREEIAAVIEKAAPKRDVHDKRHELACGNDWFRGRPCPHEGRA
jgi:hypothetical protein